MAAGDRSLPQALGAQGPCEEHPGARVHVVSRHIDTDASPKSGVGGLRSPAWKREHGSIHIITGSQTQLCINELLEKSNQRESALCHWRESHGPGQHCDLADQIPGAGVHLAGNVPTRKGGANIHRGRRGLSKPPGQPSTVYVTNGSHLVLSPTFGGGDESQSPPGIRVSSCPRTTPPTQPLPQLQPPFFLLVPSLPPSPAQDMPRVSHLRKRYRTSFSSSTEHHRGTPGSLPANPPQSMPSKALSHL